MKRNAAFHSFSCLKFNFKLLLIFLISNSVFLDSVDAQCPIEAPFCQSAVPLCGFSTDFMLPYQTNSPQPFPGCSGGYALHNPIWFSFVAESQLLEIIVSGGNCNNFTGYQAALYGSCDPGGFPLQVQCDCTLGPIIIQGFVVPGETYYLVVDGCNGDVCDMNITVTQGAVQNCGMTLGMPDAPLADQPVACPGSIITFTTNAVPGAVGYDWDFPASVVPLNIDCTTATVIWGNQPGLVTVTAFDANGNSSTSDPTFIDVEFFTGNDSGSYCFPDEPGFLYPGDGNYYPGGIWDVNLLNSNGCDSLVVLEVTEYVSIPAFVNFEICDGDTLSINGEIFTTAGSYQQLLPGATINGCDSVLLITISSGSFSLAPPVVTDASCGLCNGAIDLQVICAQAPLSIAWSGGLPNDAMSVTDLCPGSYSLTITDASGASLTSTIDVGGLPGLNIEADISSVSCAGEMDGSVDITIVSGVPNYTFDWSDDSLDGQSMASGLAGGTYGLTVTDAEGCMGMIDVIIPEPTPLVIQVEVQNISCNELGRARVVVTGGTGPYTYLWSNGSTSSVINDLEMGSYSVSVIDANGCEETADFFIASPFITDRDTLNTFETGLLSTDTLFCGQLTDTIRLNNYPSGSYNWTTTDGNILENQDHYIIVDAAGTYVVSIILSDFTGSTCIAADTITIERECCPIDFFVQSQNESCRGIGDGRARVIISGGGLPPFNFQWSDPSLPQEEEVTDLAPGNYTVTITDASGCTYTDDFEITSYLDITVTTTPTDCDGAGGSATAFANGFFISYFWSNGGNGPTQNNLAAGQYTVTAWSIFGGCQSQQTVLIEMDSSCNDAFDQLGMVDESTLEWEGSSYRNDFINPRTQKMEIQFSPNPIIDQAYLDLNLSKNQSVDLQIYNAKGKLLQEKVQQVNKGGDRISLSFKNYPAGMYYLKVVTADGRIEIIKGVKF